MNAKRLHMLLKESQNGSLKHYDEENFIKLQQSCQKSFIHDSSSSFLFC